MANDTQNTINMINELANSLKSFGNQSTLKGLLDLANASSIIATLKNILKDSRSGSVGRFTIDTDVKGLDKLVKLINTNKEAIETTQKLLKTEKASLEKDDPKKKKISKEIDLYTVLLGIMKNVNREREKEYKQVMAGVKQDAKTEFSIGKSSSTNKSTRQKYASMDATLLGNQKDYLAISIGDVNKRILIEENNIRTAILTNDKKLLATSKQRYIELNNILGILTAEDKIAGSLILKNSSDIKNITLKKANLKESFILAEKQGQIEQKNITIAREGISIDEHRAKVEELSLKLTNQKKDINQKNLDLDKALTSGDQKRVTTLSQQVLELSKSQGMLKVEIEQRQQLIKQAKESSDATTNSMEIESKIHAGNVKANQEILKVKNQTKKIDKESLSNKQLEERIVKNIVTLNDKNAIIIKLINKAEQQKKLGQLEDYKLTLKEIENERIIYDTLRIQTNEMKNQLNVQTKSDGQSDKRVKTLHEQISSYFSMEKILNRMSFVITAVSSYRLWNALTTGITRFALDAIKIEHEFSKVYQLLSDTERAVYKNYLTMDALAKASNRAQKDMKAVADSLYQILSAEFAVADATKILDQAMIGAVAGFTTLNKSTDVIIQTLRALGKTEEDVADVNDYLFTLIKYGRVTMEQLDENLGRVLNSAKNLGIGMEELGAIMAITTRSVSPEVAFTSLRQLMLSLTNPTKEAQDVLARYGLTIENINLRQNGLVRTMQKLINITDTEKVAIASSKTGFDAMANIVNQLNDYMGIYEKFVDRSGNALDAYNEKTNTTQFLVDKLGASFNYLFAEQSEFNNSVAKPMLKTLNSMIEALNENADGINLVAKALVTLTASTIIFSQLKRLNTYLRDAGILSGIATINFKKLGLAIKGIALSSIQFIAVNAIIGTIANTWSSISAQKEMLSDISLGSQTENLSSLSSRIQILADNYDNLKDAGERLAKINKELQDNGFKPIDATLKTATIGANDFTTAIKSIADTIDSTDLIDKLNQVTKPTADKFSSLSDRFGFSGGIFKSFGNISARIFNKVIGKEDKNLDIDLINKSGTISKYFEQLETFQTYISELSKGTFNYEIKDFARQYAPTFLDTAKDNLLLAPNGMNAKQINEYKKRVSDALIKDADTQVETFINSIENFSAKTEVDAKAKANFLSILRGYQTEINNVIIESVKVDNKSLVAGDSPEYTAQLKAINKDLLGKNKDGSLADKLAQVDERLQEWKKGWEATIAEIDQTKITPEERVNLGKELDRVESLLKKKAEEEKLKITKDYYEQQVKEIESVYRETISNAGYTDLGKDQAVLKELANLADEAVENMNRDLLKALLDRINIITKAIDNAPKPEVSQSVSPYQKKGYTISDAIKSVSNSDTSKYDELKLNEDKLFQIKANYEEELMLIKRRNNGINTQEEISLENEIAKVKEDITKNQEQLDTEEMNIKIKQWNDIKQAMSTAWNTSMNMMSEYYSYQSMMIDYNLKKELEALETMQTAKEKEINQSALTEKQKQMMLSSLQKKTDKEKEKLQKQASKEQAKINYKQAVANIGLALAQSLIQAWVNPGFPAALALIPFLMGFAGMQYKNAKKAYDIAREGYSEGGYTGEGTRLQPAGVVHKREVVFEAPIVDGQLSEILSIRKALQSGISAKKLLSNIQAQPVVFKPSISSNGFYGGGYTGDQSNNDQLSNQSMKQIMKDTIGKIPAIIAKPVDNRTIYRMSVAGKREIGEI